jgi:dihydropyrimidine dehydrogenase (NAD+) subunit PreA
MDIKTSYLGVGFENPFILASAPPAANGDMIRRAFEAGWAGAVVKTIGMETVKNPGNRFAVNRHKGSIIGFENLELLSELAPDAWFRIIMDLKREFPDKVIIGSIMGDARSADEWISLARGCQDAGADLLELNFSCPHGYPEKGKGAAIGQNPDYSAAITGWLNGCADISIPIIPKLTAAVADIQHIGEAVAKAGADGICAINTVPSMFGFDLKTLRPKPDIHGMTAFGGYSGLGIKPIALRAVASLCRSPGIPVMACGGIQSGYDAAEFMLLGAPVCQVCTAVMVKGYGIIKGMQKDLSEFMEWHGFEHTEAFIGRCKDQIVPFSSLSRENGFAAVLVAERCSSCGACHTACRDGGYQAVQWDGGLPVFDTTRCSGCSLCRHVCPKEAIVMRKTAD